MLVNSCGKAAITTKITISDDEIQNIGPVPQLLARRR